MSTSSSAAARSAPALAPCRLGPPNLLSSWSRISGPEMANDLLGQFHATSDNTFQQRVSAAIAVVAVQVYTETPPPANHAARAAYAVQVITNPPLSMVSINNFGTSQPD